MHFCKIKLNQPYATPPTRKDLGGPLIGYACVTDKRDFIVRAQSTKFIPFGFDINLYDRDEQSHEYFLQADIVPSSLCYEKYKLMSCGPQSLTGRYSGSVGIWVYNPNHDVVIEPADPIGEITIRKTTEHFPVKIIGENESLYRNEYINVLNAKKSEEFI